MDTSLLKTFLILNETKSFSKTADIVGRSQSAVSMQIQKLEDRLQCELFERTKRTVTLTQNGEKLIQHARKILSLSQTMLNDFLEPKISGSIRFGAPEDFTTFHLPAILSDFSQTHPNVTLNVQCDLTRNLMKYFNEDKFDLIVIKKDENQPIPNSRFILNEKLVWVISKSLLESVNPKGTTPLPLVLSPSPCVYRERAIDSLTREDIGWVETFTSPSVAGIVAAVRAGLGCAILPQEMVPSGLKIVGSATGWPKLEDAQICLLAKDVDNPAVKSLSGFIQERIIINQKI
jgi:DNA-binding transcriptional LysR family regulator